MGLVPVPAILLLPLLIKGPVTKSEPQTIVPEGLAWSERMVESQMARDGDTLAFGKSPQAKWRYETGVFLKGVEGVWIASGKDKYLQYFKRIIDSYLESDGRIRTYTLEDYNLDNVQCGKLVLDLFQHTKEERYRQAALMLMKQLQTHPRTNEGGFWHKKIYPHQMWLDGIYMAPPFYAQFSKIFDRPEGFDDVANQIIRIEEHTRDPKTGLLYHGWDESRKQEWADPVTGCSKSFWGRAMGWYAMGIADVLDFLPAGHERREEIIAIFQRLCGALTKYQDSKSGVWYQVVDQGKRSGNYLEASASSMFVYALSKGVRMGYLDGRFQSVAQSGYQGILRQFITVQDNGLLNLNRICSVAGLGGQSRRNGTFEYYISEPIVTNDLKGVGAFILASLEVEKLERKPIVAGGD